MNVLILGDGLGEWRWANALADRAGYRLAAACPGFKDRPELPGGPDLDAALAMAGIDAVIVGEDATLRSEGLRRAAGAGLPVVALHPPGENADPYYQVALSRHETGAIVVPDLPARLHPGVEAIRAAVQKGTLGAFRGLRYELPCDPDADEPTLAPFARAVDAIRACLGEIEAVTAVGDPLGGRPTESLVVQLRAADSRRAEVRVEGAGRESPARLVLEAAEGSLRLEHEPDWLGPARLVRRAPAGEESITEIAPWDPHGAILEVLERSRADAPEAHPDLLDGTRAMELAEAAVRSLRRGRTIDLHYEEVSELANFKGVMAGLGCGLLLAVLVIVPVALAGPAMGAPWTLWLARALPPILVGFILLQLLRYGLNRPARGGGPRPGTGRNDPAGARH